MVHLEQKELEAIAAIKENHRLSLERRLEEHAHCLNEAAYPKEVISWVGIIEDIRLITDHYLETVAHSPYINTEDTLEKNTTFSSYFSGIAKTILPTRLSQALFSNPFLEIPKTIFTSLTKAIFSLALGKSVTKLLLDYFIKEFSGKSKDAQEKFAEILEEDSALSRLIKAECERISVEMIKLFHFREMLLLGKLTDNPLEPNARMDFISRAHINKEKSKEINQAVEVYFNRELNTIFRTSFKSLYQVQEYELSHEMNSPIQKWLHQLFDTYEKRLSFTQEIQLKFMQLTNDFLLEQKNQPGLLATHPVLSSILTGLAVSFVLSLALGFVLSGLFVAAIAIAGAILGGVGAYVLIHKKESLAYKRDSGNRSHIQQSIDEINHEYLDLRKELDERKKTNKEIIKNTKDFGAINATFFNLVEGRNVARGSIAGWLREYASRYRHSHAVEVDLGDEYKELMSQSKGQNERLIHSINQGRIDELSQWIDQTKSYLKKEKHRKVIHEFELVQKIKEQTLEIVSQLHFIPPALLSFYCAPAAEGGLSGNESDFAHIRSLAPSSDVGKKQANPYQHLCDTALNLFKKFEPNYVKEPFFYGDTEYRHMLGIAHGTHTIAITNNNIERCLDNSYAFLLLLCSPIQPGKALDPLQQTARVTDEFILYRMLLLKQLAEFCSLENKTLNADAKHQIRQFVRKHFNQDPDVIFDDLINQKFLINKNIQTSLTYTNRDGFTVTDVELDNISQALGLDIAYNSIHFTLQEELNHFIEAFSIRKGIVASEYFALSTSEQELNPQGTKQYVDLISRYCHNTEAFLQEGATNKALAKTHILNCYRYNMSLQIYRTQYRIVKSIKELSTELSKDQLQVQSQHLLNAFQQLSAFAKEQGYALKKNSVLREMEKFIHSQTKKNVAISTWANKLDEPQMMLNHMNDLKDQLHTPLARVKKGNRPAFFNTTPKPSATQLSHQEPTASVAR